MVSEQETNAPTNEQDNIESVNVDFGQNGLDNTQDLSRDDESNSGSYDLFEDVEFLTIDDYVSENTIPVREYNTGEVTIQIDERTNSIRRASLAGPQPAP